jgi:hypothetical protein
MPWLGFVLTIPVFQRAKTFPVKVLSSNVIGHDEIQKKIISWNIDDMRSKIKINRILIMTAVLSQYEIILWV